MGYYTIYELVVEGDEAPSKERKIMNWIKTQQQTQEFFCYGLTTEHETTWDDHLEDMSAVSKAFPDYLITLYCRGQEWDDHVKYYFMGGKYQREEGQVTVYFNRFNYDQLQ